MKWRSIASNGSGVRSGFSGLSIALIRILALAVLFTFSFVAEGAGNRSERTGSVRVHEVARGLEHPWGLAFLPERKYLVTERPGRLRVIDERGRISAPIANVPSVVAIGQGGLLDVVLSPDYAESRLLFLSYAEPRDGEKTATSVVRAKLDEHRLSNVRVIFKQMPAVESSGHFGSRLVFGPDGHLFVTLGERQAKHFTVRAQGLDTHFGKIVRIAADGEVPSGNPFVDVPGALPEIWSYGHRNVQGAALHPESGDLWITEHGPKGGDELNIVRAGANYGWPLVTYGVAYNGDRIGVGQERAGVEKPAKFWVPSIGTSGLTFYTGDRFPEWTGDLFLGGLYGVLMRLELDGNRVVREEPLLRELGERIRDVRQGPDGYLYVLTDSPKGRLLRIEPAD